MIFEGRHFPEKKRNDLMVAGLRGLWMEHAQHKRSAKKDEQRFPVIIEFFGANAHGVVRARLGESPCGDRTETVAALFYADRDVRLRKRCTRSSGDSARSRSFDRMPGAMPMRRVS